MLLNIMISESNSPQSWMRTIINDISQRENDNVLSALIAAGLEYRFQRRIFQQSNILSVPKSQTDCENSPICNMVYYVTSTPSGVITRKCTEDVRVGLHVIWLVPANQHLKAQFYAEEAGLYDSIAIIPIEDYITMIIIGSALEKRGSGFHNTLQEIVAIWNNRLAEADHSLQIKISYYGCKEPA